jgi:competence protein ComEC
MYRVHPSEAPRAKLLYMRRLTLALLICVLSCFPSFAQKLSVYAIDTEGGKAVLVVSPEHESLLIDAGWPFDSRDADRIVAAARDAGVSKIDYLLITHYHMDHVGGVPWLLAKMPVAHVLDHGPTTELDSHGAQLYQAYERATQNIPHTIVKPGDTIPLKGVDIKVVSSGGKLLNNSLSLGQSENPLCRNAVTKPAEKDENEQSIGIVLQYGKFRLVDLADLTWEREHGLLCPANLVGEADLFMVSHHGLDFSNSPLLIGSLQPRAAIMNNGALKGGSAVVLDRVRPSTGPEGLWQLHSVSGDVKNASDKFIANPEQECQGYGIKVTASSDGAFTVTNQRNGYSVSYPAR